MLFEPLFGFLQEGYECQVSRLEQPYGMLYGPLVQPRPERGVRRNSQRRSDVFLPMPEAQDL